MWTCCAASDVPVTEFVAVGGLLKNEFLMQTDERRHRAGSEGSGLSPSSDTAAHAVKAAVMAEDVARTTHIARQGGDLVPTSPEVIDALFDRYQNVYGQHH
jgi:L-ribulose-5-phosphate 4-epimerase